jgi:hypothetical protein
MTGSSGAHRAPRTSRLAARQARRKRAKRRQQLFGIAVVIALLIGGAVYIVVAGAGGDGGPATQAGNAGSDDNQRGDRQMLAEDTFLLDAAGAKKLSAGSWEVSATNDGAQAPERSFTCQAQRFADSAGLRTWVRQFKNGDSTAVEYVELSADRGAAGRAYDTVLTWLATCVTPQQRLVASYTANGLGDRGVVAVFAQPVGGGKERYRTLTVTGTGPATMVLEYIAVAPAIPAMTGPVAAGADAMKRLCAETRSTCPRSQVLTPSLLAAAGEPAGFMTAIDLPVLSKVKEPWVGVDAGTNPQTDCSETNQPKVKPVKAKARTYLPVGAKVPTEFGMDTKIFEFSSAKAAGQYLTGLRSTMDKCKTSHSNVTTRRAASVGGEAGVTGQTWVVRIGLPNGSNLTYRVGAARAGQRVTYLLFLALKGLDVTDQEFATAVARAAHRSYSFK